MNKKQLIVMWLAIILTVAMILFPPWFAKSSYFPVYSYKYGPMWDPPRHFETDYRSGFSDGRIDIYRLVIQVLAVWIVAAGFMLTPSGFCNFAKIKTAGGLFVSVIKTLWAYMNKNILLVIMTTIIAILIFLELFGVTNFFDPPKVIKPKHTFADRIREIREREIPAVQPQARHTLADYIKEPNTVQEFYFQMETPP